MEKTFQKSYALREELHLGRKFSSTNIAQINIIIEFFNFLPASNGKKVYPNIEFVNILHWKYSRKHVRNEDKLLAKLIK